MTAKDLAMTLALYELSKNDLIAALDTVPAIIKFVGAEKLSEETTYSIDELPGFIEGYMLSQS